MILTEYEIHSIIAQCWRNIECMEAMPLDDPPVPEPLMFRRPQAPVTPKVVYLGSMIRTNLETIVLLTELMEMHPF